MRIDERSVRGMKVTVMGLGLNGGGLASAAFFARRGAAVTVTDLRTAEVLRPSMEQLAPWPVRYVLGRHDEADFASADVVIKNPAVPPASPFLAAARERGVPIETDLSVFLAACRSPLIAVTGSKGKSTTSSAIAFAAARVFRGTRLGGNITVSPLTFLDDLDPASPVVLELSSWQLGDLRGRGLLHPAVAALTVIVPDHLDKYPGMEEYVADKSVIVEEQEPSQAAVLNAQDPWQQRFAAATRARVLWFSAEPLPPGTAGAWLDGDAGFVRLSPGGPVSPLLGASVLQGRHNRLNLLCAGLALSAFGMKPEVARRGLAEFPGIEHRMELVREWEGVKVYNDSAATVPHATAAALDTLPSPVVLIAGGTDKNIDFGVLAGPARTAAAVLLLAGTGSDKLAKVLDAAGVAWEGPFASLEAVVSAGIARARALAAPGRPASLLFSPGCTSFGMFLNEFDRGRKFKETVGRLTGEGTPAGAARA